MRIWRIFDCAKEHSTGRYARHFLSAFDFFSWHRIHNRKILNCRRENYWHDLLYSLILSLVSTVVFPTQRFVSSILAVRRQMLTSSLSAFTWFPTSMNNWVPRLWKPPVFAPTSESTPKQWRRKWKMVELQRNRDPEYGRGQIGLSRWNLTYVHQVHG